MKVEIEKLEGGYVVEFHKDIEEMAEPIPPSSDWNTLISLLSSATATKRAVFTNLKDCLIFVEKLFAENRKRRLP